MVQVTLTCLIVKLDKGATWLLVAYIEDLIMMVKGVQSSGNTSILRW
jgi:hypothetical protein